MLALVLLALVSPLATPADAAGPTDRRAATTSPATTPPFQPPEVWRRMCTTLQVAGMPLRAGVNCRWLRLDGVFRRYVVVVPRTVAAHPRAAWPLVFMLHGHDGSGEQMMTRTDWIRVGRAANVITVFPTSWHYRYLGGTSGTRWNTYNLADVVDPDVRLDGYPADAPYPARDTEFLNRIVRDVDQAIHVDPRRIHVSGSSNGGNFISRVTMELGDLVASVSCTGFCAAAPQSAWSDATRPVPVLYGLGTNDPNVLRLLAETQDPDPDRIPLAWKASRPVVWELVRDLVATWRLHRDPTVVVGTRSTTQVTWGTPGPKGTRGAKVRLLLLRRARHMYPTTHNNPERFSMAAISWRFFVAHPMP